MDTFLPILSSAILRSAWVEPDPLVRGAMWQPLLVFLKSECATLTQMRVLLNILQRSQAHGCTSLGQRGTKRRVQSQKKVMTKKTPSHHRQSLRPQALQAHHSHIPSSCNFWQQDVQVRPHKAIPPFSSSCRQSHLPYVQRHTTE